MTKANEANFSKQALKAVPSWMWGALGTFIGVAMTLQITGYNSSLNRVIEAHVKRIEKSADSIDGSAAHITDVLKKVNDVEGVVATLSTRLARIEAHNKAIDDKYHKGSSK